MSKQENINELVVIEKANVMQVFSTDNGLDPLLAKVRAEIDSFVPDVSTKKGRDQIASIAHKVARSKTYLDGVGKDLVTELKEIPKKVDAERKRMRDLLDSWRDEVRQPLTEWEEAEQARIDRHKLNIDWFNLRADENRDLDTSELAATISEVESREVNESWEEFEAEAHLAKDRALVSLREALAAREKYEAEQAELERLRAEAAAREIADREARIASEAAERARREAQEQAERERIAAQEKADAARREAEDAARREREASEKRELELKYQAERAEREKQDAERRAEQAAADERRKIAEESAKIEAEAKAREADKKHKAAINNAALAALMNTEIMTENVAKAVISLIAKGEIPNVKIIY